MPNHNLIHATAFLTTSAVVGAVTNPTVIAAPGALLTIRVLALSLMLMPFNAAAAIIRTCHTGDLIGALAVQAGGSAYASFTFSEAGWAVGMNVALVLDLQSDAASQAVVWSAVYYLASG